MLNLSFALSAGLVTTALLAALRLLSVGEAAVPGVLVALVAYVVLARRSFRALGEVMQACGQALQVAPPRFAEATQALQRGYPIGRYQFGVTSQIDAQLGILYFLSREFGKAQPLLKRAYMWSPWMAGAMLGVIQYKKKDVAGMKRTMEVVTKKGKKQGLAWNLYAYLLLQLGERDKAQKVLTDGVRHAGAQDPRLAEALLALRNGKRFKMRAYREQWYQFHLENPPVNYGQAPHGHAKVGRIARRGRW